MLNHRDYVIAAINHEQTDKVPYTLDFEPEPAADLDEYYGNSDWRNQLQSYISTSAWIDTVVEIPIDDAHYVDAYGSVWRGDRRPFHLEKPAMPNPSFDGINWPSIDKFRLHLTDSYQADNGKNRERFGLIYIGWGLFEMSWRIRGFENMLMDSVADEDFFEELLERLTVQRLQMIEICKDINTDAIYFGDDWGDQRGVIIGPERWRKFIKPRFARLCEATHAQGKYVVNHCCGSIVDIIPDLIEIGLDVYESVQPEARGMNPFQLKKDWGDKITFWGCLGSQSTIQFSSPEGIQLQVERLCSEMSVNGGYILAPAKSVQPGTPVQNSVALIESFSKQNI